MDAKNLFAHGCVSFGTDGAVESHLSYSIRDRLNIVRESLRAPGSQFWSPFPTAPMSCTFSGHKSWVLWCSVRSGLIGSGKIPPRSGRGRHALGFKRTRPKGGPSDRSP